MKEVCQYALSRNDISDPTPFFLLVAAELELTGNIPSAEEYLRYFANLRWPNIKTILIMKNLTNKMLPLFPAHHKMDFFKHPLWFVFPLSSTEKNIFVEDKHEKEREALFDKMKKNISLIKSKVEYGTRFKTIEFNDDGKNYLENFGLRDLQTLHDSYAVLNIKSLSLNESSKEKFASNLATYLISLANIFRVSFSFYKKHKADNNYAVFKRIARQSQNMIEKFIQLINTVVPNKDKPVYFCEEDSTKLVSEKDQIILLYIQVRLLLKKNQNILSEELTVDLLKPMSIIISVLEKYKHDETFEHITKRSQEIWQLIQNNTDNNNNQCMIQ